MDGANGSGGKCPVHHHKAVGSVANQQWWPNQLNLKVLSQNGPQTDPMGADFDYATAFGGLDLNTVRQDIFALMTTSQDWWPADYGHYGPLFVRMAWHSAGTYRVTDGRGGAGSGSQRFAPLNSWPDNANLDKARMLLWPVKKKYGRALSWADLLIFAGNCALESMGFKTYGFAGGREDIWEPEEEIYWGAETEWLGDKRYSGERDLEAPLGAVQMGLIYVNPEGPNGNPDPLASAIDIRETFARMAMDDEETVALIAGGHTFGKTHGAADPDKYVGPEPEGAAVEEQGRGWKNSFGTGNAGDTITSGLEGAWTTNPIAWDNNFFDNLFNYEWQLSESPAGAKQWVPTGSDGDGTVPDAHDPSKRHKPVMLTSDLALRMDPAYGPIAKRFHDDPAAFEAAFAKAWFKLTHRDMGPVAMGLGGEVPDGALLWQDPVPARDHDLIGAPEIATLKQRVLAAGVPTAQLVRAAWASASTFRVGDKRGGTDGGRVRLEPQKNWAVNEPATLASVLSALNGIADTFNAERADNIRVSVADLIVLAGCAAVEQASGNAVSVPFTPGRTDATQDQTDAATFDVLEPAADGFRNYLADGQSRPAAELLVDRAQMLTLTAPEMTVLFGGLRTLGANVGDTAHGVFTDNPGALSTDFFVNLLDLGTEWISAGDGLYEGRDRASGAVKWTATEADLIFGSNSQLRALAEVYGSDDARSGFAAEFAAVWAKVMNLGRTDLN